MTGVKQAVPYRTGREARYLSVSTDQNQNQIKYILARTTAEQERKTRWVRCALALLVGVSFPNSAWYVYALQVVGLGAQGISSGHLFTTNSLRRGV